MQAGKGDKPRPIIDRKQFYENWDLIFRKKKKGKKDEKEVQVRNVKT